jgi:hypothetical protein
MISRILCWVALATLIGYDIVIALLGYPTISEEVRVIDAELGGLIRFGMIALWLHWFLPSKWR